MWPPSIAGWLQDGWCHTVAAIMSARAGVTARAKFRLRILSMTAGEVVLPATDSTGLPGVYWLKFPSGRWLEVGKVLELADLTVKREVVAGNAQYPQDTRARFSGYGPGSRSGPAPEILNGQNWVIHLHGLGSERASLDRAVAAAA